MPPHPMIGVAAGIRRTPIAQTLRLSYEKACLGNTHEIQ